MQNLNSDCFRLGIGRRDCCRGLLVDTYYQLIPQVRHQVFLSYVQMVALVYLGPCQVLTSSLPKMALRVNTNKSIQTDR